MIALVLALALGCGSERWAVKTLADMPDGGAAWLQAPALATTVEDLVAMEPPEPLQPDTQRQDSESVLYEVNAKLVGFKLEADRDWHVVLAGDSGATLIVELPDPHCVPPWLKDSMLATRKALLKVVKKGPTKAFRRFRSQPRVLVRGVAFYDALHGQTGVAPNGIELHPVLSIH